MICLKEKIYQAALKLFYNLTLNELSAMNKKYADSSITYNSLLYVDLIRAHHGKCTASSLAELLNVSKPGVITKVNELIKQGYIYKKQSETDKRIYYLYANEDAVPAFEYYKKMDMQVAEKMAQRYSSQEIEKFCSMLETMSEFYLDKGI